MHRKRREKTKNSWPEFFLEVGTPLGESPSPTTHGIPPFVVEKRGGGVIEPVTRGWRIKESSFSSRFFSATEPVYPSFSFLWV